MEWTKQLSNENLVFLYLENLETLQQFEKIIKDSGIKTEVDMPLFGKRMHIHPLADNVIESMRNCLLVKQLKEVDSVLEPIALLIRDSDPDLYKKIEDSINIKFDL